MFSVCLFYVHGEGAASLAMKETVLWWQYIVEFDLTWSTSSCLDVHVDFRYSLWLPLTIDVVTFTTEH